MRTRSSSNLIVESFTISKRHNRRRSKQIVKPKLRSIVETHVANMADTDFKLKVGLLQLVTSSQFHGFERDDPHARIRWVNNITTTLKYKIVPHDAIKLMLFLFSLEGAAWKNQSKKDKIKNKRKAWKSPESSPTKSKPGILEDKIICDLDKTLDLSQRSPQNWSFTSCVENGILQDSSESSNDDTNVVNALREPFVVNQDPSKNPSQIPPQINHYCCYGCGDPLEGIFCRQCTCELCGNGAHYGYNCLPKVSIIPDSKSFNNQTIKELPPTMQGFDPKSDLVHDSPNEIPACYDDDDDDYTFAITPKEPDNSLSMGDKHLDTVSATESNEFIKSSVENLVPILSESGGEHECDMPACEDFTTFLNILFDSDYDFYSSDNQSFSNEDFPKEIYLNPLFDEEIISIKIDPHHYNAESNLIKSLPNHDSSIISSSKMDSLFDEFADELTLLKSISLRSDATDCDYEEETYFIERLFDSLIEEIDLSFTLDYPMSPGIEEDDYDSERDILILKELLSNDFLLLHEKESFHFDIPSFSHPPAKPPDGNTRILNVKMIGDISKQKVPMPRLMFTQSILVLRQEKSPDLLSHLGHEAFQPSTECPMMIHGKNTPILDVPLFHFYPS
nr:reverse transcriptase domain-containing protein [Tanacetum cinerariifolium]